MSSNLHNPEAVQVVVITVCTGPIFAQELADLMREKPWSVSFSHFDSYLSLSRRPSFGPQLKAASACIVFVDFDVDIKQAIGTAQYLTKVFPGKMTVVAVSKGLDHATILTAMRAGCSEFLNKPLDHALLSDLFDQVERTWLTVDLNTSKPGTILSFFGAKGGSGTTTLAVHLAIYLTQRHQKKTLLIDHHPELGHVCIYLGIDGSRYTFQELIRNVGRLDSELLQGFIARHGSGLHVLSSPDVCGLAPTYEPHAIARTIEFLRTEYDYIIVDGDVELEDPNLPVLEASTQIYLVASPEVGAIRDLSRHVDRLLFFDHAADKMQVVLNRVSSSHAIPVEQIEKAVKLPVAIRIPSDYAALVRSDNLGEPIPPDSNTPFSNQFVKWVDELVGGHSEPKSPKKSKGLVRSWLSPLLENRT